MTMKKKLTGVLAMGLVLIMAIAGISAYFTDGDTATNTFTTGKVSMDLTEPSFEEDKAVNLTPEQEIAKDPQITNNGINDEYVFVEVIVPCAFVETANDDGSYNDEAKTELFSWDVNPGWALVEKEETDAANTYVYGWVGYTVVNGAKINDTTMKALAKNETTDAVFNYVRFANVTENANLEEATLDIVINGYGIQTTNLHDADTTVDGNNADGVTSPAAVWSVVEIGEPDGEMPSTAKTGEDGSTDMVTNG